MRFFLPLIVIAPALWAAVAAFAPPTITHNKSSKTQLKISRRDTFLISGAAVLFGLTHGPRAAAAAAEKFSHPSVNSISIISPEVNYEPQQQATGGKVDLNAATVGEYKQFPGMFPHAAGKIASNGPYEKVSDIFNIEGLTENDKKSLQNVPIRMDS
mmetsp:Transcript_1345/g.1712  ORF Transcript_1345/g.1712 Transcript_1345/m.1712 type:complete len:157 (-) Transcript_1345:390-860(-)